MKLPGAGGVRVDETKDRFNQMHEVDNVLVVDGSSFTSASEKNPTLTILAPAWRAGDHLAEELRSGRL